MANLDWKDWISFFAGLFKNRKILGQIQPKTTEAVHSKQDNDV